MTFLILANDLLNLIGWSDLSLASSAVTPCRTSLWLKRASARFAVHKHSREISLLRGSCPAVATLLRSVHRKEGKMQLPGIHPVARQASSASSSSSSLSTGAKIAIGASIAGAVVLAILGAVIFWLWRKHRRQAAFVAQGKPHRGTVADPSRTRDHILLQKQGRSRDTAVDARQGVAHASSDDKAVDAAYEDEEDQDGEPWPPRKGIRPNSHANFTQLPPPAPGPFSYV